MNKLGIDYYRLPAAPIGGLRPDPEVIQSASVLITMFHDRRCDKWTKVMTNFTQLNSPKTQRTFNEFFQNKRLNTHEDHRLLFE